MLVCMQTQTERSMYSCFINSMMTELINLHETYMRTYSNYLNIYKLYSIPYLIIKRVVIPRTDMHTMNIHWFYGA